MDDFYPKFGLVNNILVLGGDLLLFVLTLAKVLFNDDHKHSYVVSLTANQTLVPYSHLSDPTVLHAYKSFVPSDKSLYIITKHFFLICI